MTVSERLAHRRSAGETLVEVDEDSSGPVLRVVTDQASALVDSITVLLHRLGVGYLSMTHSSPLVTRDADGVLTGLDGGGPAIPESWITADLAPPVNWRALAEAVRLLPMVVADARQVAADSSALTQSMRDVADAMDADSGARFPGPDRTDVAGVLRWLLDGNFVVLGFLRCTVGGGQALADESSRLGVARLRTEVLPQLSTPDELLVLAQATMPSFLRYGAYPYIVVVRERGGPGEAPAIEHRFVGLFTAAARNANVLEIPLAARRVQQALTQADADPTIRVNCCSRCSRPSHARNCSPSIPRSCWRWRRR